ncbi:ABC transporter permease [Alkalihalobacillus sp. AL-G]|uniref:ABC transporter permease n=1 Tax=Alkalihalobacillus sp. AL-G TaxID=2926399 RepID=UPI00272CA43E|nr:ABC transporter permease subunit [Alkalihalobacillus sp. AL-G]WLD93620.1 ABC transporter permease subunit [Alkalihalobacillus sp. AL-G]
MTKNKTLLVGSFMFLIVLFMMLVGPHLSFIDPKAGEEIVRVEEGVITAPPYPPSLEDPFGSTERGRDLLSLVVIGTKDTLLLVFAVTVIRYILSVPLALFATKKKGLSHWILNGWNQLFSGLSVLFSAILLLNVPFLTFNENRVYWSILILALIEVGRVAYIFQQQTYTISKSLYIDAAVTVGSHPLSIYFRHYLPALMPKIISTFFIDLGRVLLLIGQLGIFSIFINQKLVQLSFSHGELQNTSHNWATLLGTARGDLLTAFWIPFFPALAITFTIITFNLLGEGLRQHFEQPSSSRFQLLSIIKSKRMRGIKRKNDNVGA